MGFVGVKERHILRIRSKNLNIIFVVSKEKSTFVLANEDEYQIGI